ncbi:hypothetical protein FKM82_003915 [Ascaphus truei]
MLSHFTQQLNQRRPSLKTMNSSTNESNSQQFIESIKACVYLVDFIVCSVFTVLIIQTVWRDSVLKKEVRYFLLCHHLMCLTLFFGLGTIFSGMRAFQVNAPVLVCWIVFAVQIAIGRGLMLTLTLMALNTCIAVCWPLRYLAFVHSVKLKVTACMWIIAVLNPAVSVVYESIKMSPQFILHLDPTCPSSLTSIIFRIAGMAFIMLLALLILASYILIFREGRRTGHFNSSNKQARRTIAIHGLQIALHVLPTLVTIWIGGKAKYIVMNLANFIIFSFAQCCSPVVYGLRCTELRHKFIVQRNRCFTVRTSDSNGEEQLRNGYSVD